VNEYAAAAPELAAARHSSYVAGAADESVNRVAADRYAIPHAAHRMSATYVAPLAQHSIESESFTFPAVPAQCGLAGPSSDDLWLTTQAEPVGGAEVGVPMGHIRRRNTSAGLGQRGARSSRADLQRTGHPT
jgi:hypothetical protein